MFSWVTAPTARSPMWFSLFNTGSMRFSAFINKSSLISNLDANMLCRPPPTRVAGCLARVGSAISLNDQVVTWFKPKEPLQWMTPEQFASLPQETTVRELRYRVETPGFRTSEIILVTTLLDPEVYSAEAVANLYYCRWQIETNFKDLKITMNMNVLRCKTLLGVFKELAVFALAYNLVRSTMAEAASLRGVDAIRISLQDTVRWLTGSEAEQGGGLRVILINRRRPGRVEPRVIERRPKSYPRMTVPRAELRKRLLGQQVPA